MKIPSVDRVVPCGRIDGSTNEQKGMTKLIFAFRNFEKTPKNLKSNLQI